MPRLKAVLAGALLLLTLSVAAFGASAPHYKIVHRLLLGGEGGWDALTVDAPTHRLFLTHGTRVQVVDVKTDSVVGEIPDTPGAHGVALAPELHHGFTSNGRDSSVTMFDSRTLAVLDRIKLAARNPDAIEYDPASKRVFVFNGGSACATAIDAAAGRIVGTVPLDGKPEFAVADGKGTMYVNLEDSSAVLSFDTRTFQILHRWPLAPGEEPSGLAMDREHRRLFAACSNKKLVVLDADNGHVVSVLPIGDRVDGAAFDPSRKVVFSSNGEGTLTVIHEDGPDTYKVLENAPTQAGARTLALDESTGRVYLPTAEFGPPPSPTADRPHPRGSVVPGTFVVLVAGHESE
jgi:DNA-binding beta-propeller fold protein YncE